MDQHLSRILSTNAPPSALEVSSLETRMNDLNTRITQLRSQLQELEKLEGQLRQYRGALSPIRRIPPEVLGEIFRYVLPSVEDAGSEGVVVELGLVCKGWREATFGVHHFWSHLTVRELVGRHDETVAWLSRSGTLPRTLRLRWAWGGSPHKCSKGSCRFSSVEAVKLLGSGPEIQHLLLECQRPRCLQQLLDLLDEVGPRPPNRTWDKIQSLDLIFGDDDEYWRRNQGPTAAESPEPPSVFSRLPPINSLTLSLPCVDAAFFQASQSRFGTLDIPQALLDRLTFFKFRCNWDGNHILDILRHCPNLETLVFDTRYRNWRPRGLPMVGMERILLPKLRRLRLDHDGMFNLLNCVSAPGLETLELRGDGGPNGGSLGYQLEYTNLPESPFRNVRTLHLYDREFTEPFELIHIFWSLPALTHVKLDRIVVDWEHAWSDMFAENGGPLLVHLEVLEVLQIKQEHAEGFFPAFFGFLVDREPRPCELTVSFEEASLPSMDDAERAWTAWKSENAVSGKNLDEFGISLRIVPPVDVNGSEEEE